MHFSNISTQGSFFSFIYFSNGEIYFFFFDRNLPNTIDFFFRLYYTIDSDFLHNLLCKLHKYTFAILFAHYVWHKEKKNEQNTKNQGYS